MINLSATYTDQYQLTMAQVYFHNGGANQQAIFDYFFRKNPFEGGYTIFAGLENILQMLEKLRFTDKDIAFLRESGFDPKFLDYLKNFRFKGNIFSSREGDLLFPTRPVLRVEGNIIEAQLIETLLLNILNFQSLIATKARRMRLVAGERKLIDFGMRRAQGLGSYHASRAAIVGGFDATSNVSAARDFNIPLSGTMAHSFVQSFDDELQAFRTFAEGWPDDCILLVDTYDTIGSGIPNAIKVAKEMKEKGKSLQGVRLDSGDLAYLAKQSRKILDEAGFPEVKIAASNQLDEYLIKSLLDQNAPIDVFGVGTSLVTGSPDAALDGVYKLAFTKGKSRIKLSENRQKTNLPGRKQVFRILDQNNNFYGADVVALEDEKNPDIMFHPFEKDKHLEIHSFRHEPLLLKVMDSGKRLHQEQSLYDISSYSKQRLEKLPEEFKRITNPHIYKVGLSGKLQEEREKRIQEEIKEQNKS